MPKVIMIAMLLVALTGCATTGDSAADAFAKETSCPVEKVRFEALLDGSDLFQVTGCGKSAHYSCPYQDDGPIVCNKLPQ